MSTIPTLSRHVLNRTLLARQHLLVRSPLAAGDMVEHLVGMQTQIPRNPYVALWSRIEGFEREALESLIEDRAAVRMSVMRTTLHLVTARDAIGVRPVVQALHERAFASGNPFQPQLAGLDLAQVADAGRRVLDDETLTIKELGQRLGLMWPGRDPASLAYAVRYLVPIVQVTPRGLWRRSGQPRWRTLEAWLGRPIEDGVGPDELVLRYLRAFGPASVADIATWSWLTRVREVVDRLRPILRVYRDERGAELYDVEDGQIADPDTPAAARFLPEFDNVTLSHADRSRIMLPQILGRLDGYAGTFLVDGFVSGQWRMYRNRTEGQMVLEPFGELTEDQSVELVAEAQRLVRWTAWDWDPERVEIMFGSVRGSGERLLHAGRGATSLTE